MPGVVEVRNLCKSYAGIEAVRGISFEVGYGEVFSLLGPNGAGKTTTVEILEGLRKRSSGEVTVMGKDPEESMNELRTKVGILPQDFNFIYNITPREALNYYKESLGLDADPDEVLARVELTDSASKIFEKLSGGQKQKMGVAIALLNDPDLVFLDEPTAGLDPVSRRALWKVIEDMKARGKSIILTTHYLDEAEKLADHVAIINRGVIIASGTPKEIVSTHHKADRIMLSGSDNLQSILSSMQIQYKKEGKYLVIESDSIDALFSMVGRLKESSDDIDDLILKRETLEDVFVRMVGESTGYEN